MAAPTAVDLWRRVLLRIPTVFGRLALVASTRESEDRYEHPVLSAALTPEEVSRTLRNSHYQVFAQWLALSLEEQKADLDEFLREFGAPRHAARYQELIPPAARDVERQLYLTDLETVLELLRFESGGAWPTPEPSPRRSPGR